MSDALTRLSAALAGRYRLVEEIGRGGMATVYLAHDPRHDRDVALKVLHPELGAVIGADRFLAEIKVTAKLQHPHILGLIDSGEADGLLFYVMPFVKGESLRARLQREKQLPVPDAIRIATEVASALDYAHRQGVIHRDIKPENVLLHDGQALVADFGIALALTSAGRGRMTQTGMSLGTPNYMSPEQAMGEREITARSDVYSLGAMTYEMLSGDPPFTGSTVQAIMAKVMTEKPAALRTVRETVPLHVESAVLTALSKLPADRWGSAKELGEALNDPSMRRYEGTGFGTAVSVPTSPKRVALLGVPLLLVGALLGWMLRRPPAVIPSFPVEFAIETDSTFVIDPEASSALALSADGSRLAYLGRTGAVRQIYERRLGAAGIRAIPGTEGASDPFYSPDGAWIAFEGAGRTLVRAPTGGGATQVLNSDLGSIWGGSWWNDGSIVVAAGNPQGLFLIPSGGLRPERLTTPDSAKSERHGYPSHLPGGEAVLFSSYVQSNRSITPRVGVVELSSRTVTWLDLPGLMPRYISSGEILYGLSDGSVMAQRFDLGSRTLRGQPRRVQDGVHMALNILPVFTASPTGVLVFQPGVADATGLLRVDRQGRSTVLLRGPGIWSPRFSPMGDRIAYARATGDRSPGGRDIWIYSVGDATNTRLTHDLSAAVDPGWSADGRSIAFAASVDGNTDLWIIPADGAEAPRRLLNRPNAQVQPAFTADGKALVFLDGGAQGTGDLLRTSTTPGSPVDTVLATPFDESTPDLSLDGKWLAYQSAETGQLEVYVRPYPGPGARHLISTGGGREPAWDSSGRILYYRSGIRLVAATLALGTEVSVRGRDYLFDAPFITGRGNRNYDVAPDGRSFLFLDNAVQPHLIVRLNALTPEPR